MLNRGIHRISGPRSVDVLNELIHRLLKNLKKRLGVEADPESHDEERHKRQHFTWREVVQLLVFRIRHGAEEDALVEP